MKDAIALTTEQLVEIRNRARVIANPAKPIIALPEFDLQYTETRQNGANYILQYSWKSVDNFDNVGNCIEIRFRLSYDSKELFRIYVGIEETPEDDSPYRMFCGVEDGYVLDKYWKDKLETVPEDSDFANWQSIAYDFLLINSYIAYHDQDELFEVEERVAKMPSKKTNKKKSGTNKVRLYRVYKLRKSWQSAKKLKTPHKIECGAWGVRGHFRHYKNGQTIFIKAYVKGKDKANYKGKEYKLLGAIS